MLLAARSSADGVAFLKCAIERIGDKAPDFMDDNTLVLIFHQMAGQITPATALIANEDHGESFEYSPNAFRRCTRMNVISSCMDRSCASCSLSR